ncbi:MAG: hypothetical protein BWY94_01424 [Actinobacteria bacterium ADurb.BinA094]|nr:MAG: hypothetical protein BWY94_01424 [Actinobacteria bacterium ADurb.BinA094]
MIRLKRAYEDAATGDGRRVLVERLWPRGVTKEKAALDLWLKDVAPSRDLRTWFGHDPAKWPEFRRRYREELDGREDEVAQLADLSREGTVTFVYGARDEEHNAAVVLKEYVEERLAKKTA